MDGQRAVRHIYFMFLFTVSAPYGISIPARYSTGTGGMQAILLQKQNRQFMVDKRRFPWYTNRR